MQKVGDLYYLYYAVSSFGTQESAIGTQESAIGLATSETMEEGTWTDKGSIVTSTTGDQYNAIDANLLVDGSANYLTFGSFWQDIFQVTLNGDATSSTSTPVNVAFDPATTHPVEGAYLYKYGDYYYLFYSWGTCCGYDTSRPAEGEEYKIKVCRSSTPTGNFVSASFSLLLLPF